MAVVQELKWRRASAGGSMAGLATGNSLMDEAVARRAQQAPALEQELRIVGVLETSVYACSCFKAPSGALSADGSTCRRCLHGHGLPRLTMQEGETRKGFAFAHNGNQILFSLAVGYRTFCSQTIHRLWEGCN